MATYYVDGKNGNDSSGNGNSNNPWKSINKALRVIKPNDTVAIRTAVYREELEVNVDNVTFKADDGHQPVLDGGYHEGLISGGKLPPPDGYLPGARFGNLIRLKGNGITVDGLTVQNVAGRAFGCSGSRNTIRNCRIDFCYSSGIVVQGNANGAAGTLIENNTITRCSVVYYDPTETGVAGTININYCENVIVRHNIIAYGHGEGINSGRGSVNLLIEGNVVHSCNHVHLYINRARNVTLRNNFVYHLYVDPYLGADGRPPSGVVIGDESGPTHINEKHSSGSVIYNNIVVGMDINFQVRNNSNYNTQLEDTYIAYNTFVARKMTRFNIGIAGNLVDRHHRRSLFENNVIASNFGNVGKASGNVSGITFRNNLWSSAPDQVMRGPGDRTGDARLANPDAPISGTPPGSTNADPFNYQLTKNSSLAIGAAGDGGNADGFRPPKVDRDFFNASRDDKPDLGAHEFGGQVSAISANFTIGPGQETGLAPHTVDFTDRSTSDSVIVKWNWDFGDGSSSAEQSPSHTYVQPGSFTVKLSIEDQKGQKDTIAAPALITALSDSPDISPESFRRFILVENATDAILAFGVQYPDLNCVLLWNEDPLHILNYARIEDVAEAYVEANKTSLVWIDPQVEPVEVGEPLQSDDELLLF